MLKKLNVFGVCIVVLGMATSAHATTYGSVIPDDLYTWNGTSHGSSGKSKQKRETQNENDYGSGNGFDCDSKEIRYSSNKKIRKATEKTSGNNVTIDAFDITNYTNASIADEGKLTIVSSDPTTCDSDNGCTTDLGCTGTYSFGYFTD